MGRGAFLHAHLGISKAHSNTTLCMYIYENLCSGGTEAVYILNTSLHVYTQLQFLLNTSLHVAAQPFRAQVCMYTVLF